MKRKYLFDGNINTFIYPEGGVLKDSIFNIIRLQKKNKFEGVVR